MIVQKTIKNQFFVSDLKALRAELNKLSKELPKEENVEHLKAVQTELNQLSKELVREKEKVKRRA